MTNETPSDPTPDEVSFGPAAPTTDVPAHGRARRTGRALTWVAVGAIGATVLTGVAFAATGDGTTPSATRSAAPSGDAGPGKGGPGGPGGPGRGFGGHGGGVFGGLRGDVLHGEFVVKDGDATKTMLGQTGEITKASSTELTVKSTDGFTATWSLSDATTKVRGFALKQNDEKDAVSGLEVGATVFVVGTKSSATSGAATAVSVKPTAAQLEEFKKNLPDRKRDGRPGRAPAPAPTASTTGSSTGA